VWVSGSSTSPDLSYRMMTPSPSLIRDLSAIPGASMLVDAPLGALTTIRTGSAAAALVTVEDAQAAVRVMSVVRTHDVPSYCLGAGSDLLVADTGYPGVVIRLGEGVSWCALRVRGPGGDGGRRGTGGSSCG